MGTIAIPPRPCLALDTASVPSSPLRLPGRNHSASEMDKGPGGNPAWIVSGPVCFAVVAAAAARKGDGRVVYMAARRSMRRKGEMLEPMWRLVAARGWRRTETVIGIWMFVVGSFGLVGWRRGKGGGQTLRRNSMSRRSLWA